MLKLKLMQLTNRFKKFKWWQQAVVIIMVIYLGKYIFNAFTEGTGRTEMFDGTDDGYASQGTRETGQTLACTMYYAPWCGHCKTAKPEWIKIENELHGKTINGTKLLITKIDCDKYPKVAEEENIQGFPTFKFKMNGKEYDYNSGRTYNDFKQFIEGIVNV